MSLNKIQINATFSIISQHTQRGLSLLRSKHPFCGTGSGASPPDTPENGTTEKSKIFQLYRYRITPKEENNE